MDKEERHCFFKEFLNGLCKYDPNIEIMASMRALIFKHENIEHKFTIKANTPRGTNDVTVIIYYAKKPGANSRPIIKSRKEFDITTLDVYNDICTYFLESIAEFKNIVYG